MVISTSLDNLMGAVDLLHEHEEGEGVRHDEVRDTDGLVWDTCEELQIHAITPTDDEGDILTLILCALDRIDECGCREMCSSLIQEYDTTLHLRESLHDHESLLHFYILAVGMGDGLETLNIGEFLYTLLVFCYRFSEVFVSVGDGQKCDHDTIIEKNFDKYTFFHRIRPRATLAQLVEHRFCKPAVISSSLIGGSRYGSVPEWSNGEDCKSFGFAFVGSIPTRPTIV